jgi:type I restriction enzyme S subunit
MKNGWQHKRIGDLCQVIAGQSPEGKFYNTDGKGIPFYQGKKDFGEKFIEDPTTWTTQATKIARKGDILMSVRAPVGPVNFATNEVCIGRGLAAIRGRGEINRDFLFYQLLHLQPEIAGKEGAVFASINKAAIEALPIAFAAPSEQQRIVAILDGAFEGIANAKANAKRSLQNVRELFRSTLYAALSGGLPSDWREDRSPAKESHPHLDGSNCDGGRIGWGSRDLESLLIEGRKISYGIVKPGRHDPTGVRLIKSQQVRDDTMDLSANFRITKALDEEYARTRLRGGEILLNLVGASIGRSAIAPKELRGANVSRAIAVIPVRHELSPWIQYSLRGPVGQSLIQSKTGGSAQPVLNLSVVKKLTIPFPPLGEQQAIVKKLDALSEATQRLESIYRRKLAALEVLKKSLMHQAFSGSL